MMNVNEVQVRNPWFRVMVDAEGLRASHWDFQPLSLRAAVGKLLREGPVVKGYDPRPQIYRILDRRGRLKVDEVVRLEGLPLEMR